MSSFKEMRCWEIMNCTETEDCPARLFADIPCWEVARVLGTNRAALDVCTDCIVYIIKAKEPILTEEELDAIVAYRDVMRFVGKCPVYESRQVTGKVSRKIRRIEKMQVAGNPL